MVTVKGTGQTTSFSFWGHGFLELQSWPFQFFVSAGGAVQAWWSWGPPELYPWVLRGPCHVVPEIETWSLSICLNILYLWPIFVISYPKNPLSINLLQCWELNPHPTQASQVLNHWATSLNCLFFIVDEIIVFMFMICVYEVIVPPHSSQSYVTAVCLFLFILLSLPPCLLTSVM